MPAFDPKKDLRRKKVTTSAPKTDEAGNPVLNPKGDPIMESVTVGIAEVPDFPETQDGLLSAVDFYASQGGASYVMKTFNTQNLTNAMNKIRSDATKGPSEGDLQIKATQILLGKAQSDPAFYQQAMALVTDPARFQAEIIQPIVAGLKAESAKARADQIRKASAEFASVADTEGEEASS